MSESHIDRRRVLALGAMLGAWSAVGRTAAASQDAPPDDNRVYSFAVQIAGLPDASKNIREIAVDELRVAAREMKGQGDVQIDMVRPGSVDFGSATLTCAIPPGAPADLRTWFEEAAAGKNIRKNITVTLFKSDKTPGRSYNLADCFPTQWSSVNFDTSSTVQTETVTVKIGRIEFKT